MKQFSDQEIIFTPDNILPNLALTIQKTIVCHYADEDILQKEYFYNEDSEQIHIIIFGSHAHSLLPRDECDKMVMDTTEIQKDMGEKRVMDLKNIQKAVKEVELNGDRIKKPKQRNPSTLKICTYDMETCDTSMEHKKKEDTTIYALGFYDGTTYKEIYKKDYDNVLDRRIRSFLGGIRRIHTALRTQRRKIRHILITETTLENGKYRESGKLVGFWRKVDFLGLSVLQDQENRPNPR